MPPTSIETEKGGSSTKKGFTFEQEGSHNGTKGMSHPHQIPKFQDNYSKRKWMLEHMAGAFRVMGRKGYALGSAGHLSIRDPVSPDTFWINPLNKHFSLIKVSDLVHVDFECKILPDGNQAAVNAAGFSIHAAIHKARPDINSACHTHSINGKAYSTFGKELEMINQDACLFYKRQAVYSNFGGVALDETEGEEIAEALGPHGMAAILQNHGLLTLGKTADEAAALFIVMEDSCHAQLLADAASAGGYKKHIIADDVADYTCKAIGDSETLYTELQPDLELEYELCNGAYLN